MLTQREDWIDKDAVYKDQPAWDPKEDSNGAKKRRKGSQRDSSGRSGKKSKKENGDKADEPSSRRTERPSTKVFRSVKGIIDGKIESSSGDEGLTYFVGLSSLRIIT